MPIQTITDTIYLIFLTVALLAAGLGYVERQRLYKDRSTDKDRLTDDPSPTVYQEIIDRSDCALNQLNNPYEYVKPYQDIATTLREDWEND